MRRSRQHLWMCSVPHAMCYAKRLAPGTRNARVLNTFQHQRRYPAIQRLRPWRTTGTMRSRPAFEFHQQYALAHAIPLQLPRSPLASQSAGRLHVNHNWVNLPERCS